MDSVWIIGAKYLVVLPFLMALAACVLAKGQARKAFLLRALFAALIAFILAKLIGAFTFEARPFTVLHRPPLIPHEADSGLPSDHALLAFTAALLALTVDRKLGLAALGMALFVAASRVATLLHSPLDILVSAVFAVIAVGEGFLVFKSPSATAS